MDTLEQILQDHLINEIFPSFCDDHKRHLTFLIRLLVADWLTKKHAEINGTEATHSAQRALLMELLEELKK